MKSDAINSTSGHSEDSSKTKYCNTYMKYGHDDSECQYNGKDNLVVVAHQVTTKAKLVSNKPPCPNNKNKGKYGKERAEPSKIISFCCGENHL